MTTIDDKVKVNSNKKLFLVGLGLGAAVLCLGPQGAATTAEDTSAASHEQSKEDSYYQELKYLGSIPGAEKSDAYFFFQIHHHVPGFERDVTDEDVRTITTCQYEIYEELDRLISTGNLSAEYFEGALKGSDIRESDRFFYSLDSLSKVDKIDKGSYSLASADVLLGIKYLGNTAVSIAGWEEEDNMDKLQPYVEFIHMRDVYDDLNAKQESKIPLTATEKIQYKILEERLPERMQWADDKIIHERSIYAFDNSYAQAHAWFAEHPDAPKGYAVVIGRGHNDDIFTIIKKLVKDNEALPAFHFYFCK